MIVVLIHISVESQKGPNAVQQYLVEKQKDAIILDDIQFSSIQLSLFQFTVLAPFSFSMKIVKQH